MPQSATVPLAAAVKGARSIGLTVANVSVFALEAAIAEIERLAAENPLDGMALQGCALGQHPAWAIEGDGSLSCPWCAIDQLAVERDQARLVAQRIHGERVSFWQTPGPEYLSRLGLDALPPWLTEGTAAPAVVEPIHFTTTGTVSICGRRASSLPKGIPFTLAFDPDDDAIDCRECGLYLQGLRAAVRAIAGSPR